MKTLCIVPCGSTKIWNKNPGAGPSPAEHVYIGAFSKKCREYAEHFYPLSWCILSAKYGFVWPDEIIPGSYNVSFNDLKTKPIGKDQLILQAREKGLDEFDELVTLGGRKYLAVVSAVFHGKRIVAPLSDCRGIGFIMAKMKRALLTGIRL